MAENFIEVPIETDADTLADNAIDVLQAQWEDWEPNEGDLEVVQIEALSQMAADVADVAAIMPNAAFEAILERLFNVVPQDGTPATGAVTFNLVDTTANLIPAGTEVDIDGFAFSVDDDTPTVAGSATVVGVPVTANDNDTDANGLTGETVTLVGVFLDPTTWGSNLSTPSPTPDVEPRVRKNKLIDVIGSVTGVDYVIDLTITGSAGSVQSNGDWLMPGVVPIPSPGTITGTAA
jgi:hypothetical protein